MALGCFGGITMKRYRIELVDGPIGAASKFIILTILCFSLIGLPLAVALLPTLYRVVEEE